MSNVRVEGLAAGGGPKYRLPTPDLPLISSDRRATTRAAVKHHQEEAEMKTWKKPVMQTVEAGFEVSRYLPAELGTCKR